MFFLNLKHSIDERFHALEREYLVLSKCKFLDIKTWPSDNLLSFCNNDVEYLIEHFSIPLQKANVAESDVCVGEFKDLKSFYGPQIDDFKSVEFWALVYRSKRKRFENFLKLIEILLCLPFSTAVVERGFSSLRRIMSDWRSCLGHELITDCLHFSTRKKLLTSASYRDQLVKRASEKFLMPSEDDSDGGLSTRQINLLAKQLEVKVDHIVESSSDSD